MGSLQEASTCRGEWLLPSLTRVFFPTGHFAKDCFMQPGGTKYSLIPEEEEEKEEGRRKGREEGIKCGEARHLVTDIKHVKVWERQ